MILECNKRQWSKIKMEKSIGVAVIGAGGRSRGVVLNLLRDGKTVRVVSVYDPDQAISRRAVDFWKQDTQIHDSYMDAINAPGVDWVMVFSPNAFHKEHIIAGFKAGKHVFSEKPLATAIEDCQEIYDAHQASGCMFATGFVLRYAPIYKKVKELLDSGYVGQILSIDANENISPAHGAYIMRNWRRKADLAGSHILEKCCHDLDLLNWFTGSVPSRVAAFGGLDFFIPRNSEMLNKFKQPNGSSIFDGWEDPHAEPCPFKSDKEMMDTLVAIMQYRNGIKVQFQATMSNAIPERRMYISGSEGTIKVELYSSTIEARRLDEEAVRKYDFRANGHGGGDDFITKELYDTMINGTPPKCSGDEGLESSIAAIAIDNAAIDGNVFDLEPVWKKLNR